MTIGAPPGAIATTHEEIAAEWGTVREVVSRLLEGRAKASRVNPVLAGKEEAFRDESYRQARPSSQSV